jgi:hypothetical protein
MLNFPSLSVLLAGVLGSAAAQTSGYGTALAVDKSPIPAEYKTMTVAIGYIVALVILATVLPMFMKQKSSRDSVQIGILATGAVPLGMFVVKKIQSAMSDSTTEKPVLPDTSTADKEVEGRRAKLHAVAGGQNFRVGR